MGMGEQFEGVPLAFSLEPGTSHSFKGAQVLLKSDESYGAFPQKNTHSYNRLYTI